MEREVENSEIMIMLNVCDSLAEYIIDRGYGTRTVNNFDPHRIDP